MKTFWVIVIIVVLALLGFYYTRGGAPAEQPAASETPAAEQPTVPGAPATGAGVPPVQ